MSNVVVNAGAGTGKTWTIKTWVKRAFCDPYARDAVPSQEQKEIWDAMTALGSLNSIYMTSFTSDAAEQLGVGLPKEVHCSSTYGMGLRVAKTNGMAKRVDTGGWKYVKILSEFMGDVKDEHRWKGARQAIEELCVKARLELYRQVDTKQLNDLAEHYGVEIPSHGADMALNAINYMLREGLKRVDEFDYTDMVWIPTLHMIIPKEHDLIIVDEYQDMGKAQQEICYRMAKHTVAIGDPHQAIYGFIGADSDAYSSFIRTLGRRIGGVSILPLNQTRRCAKAIVEAANKYVPELKAADNAIDGKVTYCATWNIDLKSLDSDTMVICPTNAPLVSLLFQMQKFGIKGYIRKSDLVHQMISYVTSHTKGIEELRSSIERMIEKYSSSGGRRAAINRDKYQCLKEIADECTTTSAVAATINSMFPTRPVPMALPMSTVHRAKGLEWNKILFWEYDRCGALAEQPWEHEQAKNQLYVGITRAKKELTMARSR